MRLSGEPVTWVKRYDPEIKLSLSDARAQGYAVYWTGKPCKKGHIAHRRVARQQCTACHKEWGQVTKYRRLAAATELCGVNACLRRKAEDFRARLELERELRGDL
jgi:hypothetical protein